MALFFRREPARASSRRSSRHVRQPQTQVVPAQPRIRFINELVRFGHLKSGSDRKTEAPCPSLLRQDRSPLILGQRVRVLGHRFLERVFPDSLRCTVRGVSQDRGDVLGGGRRRPGPSWSRRTPSHLKLVGHAERGLPNGSTSLRKRSLISRPSAAIWAPYR